MRASIDAMKNRARQLAVAMNGVESTAMYICCDHGNQITGEDMAEIACQIQAVQLSARGLSRTLTRAFAETSGDLDESELSSDQIRMIRAFCMTPEQIKEYDLEVLTPLLDDEGDFLANTPSQLETKVLSNMLTATEGQE